jgi:ABC-type dipeptide/oligopeptide/nickel transport system permease subunit
VLTLVLVSVGPYVYVVRTITLGVAQDDHVTLARAKGMPERIVARRHVLRVAAPPIVTGLILGLAGSLGGSILVETVFDWRGMGRLYYEAIVGTPDEGLIIGLTFMFTLLYVAARMILEVLYLLLDPRVRYEDARPSVLRQLLDSVRAGSGSPRSRAGTCCRWSWWPPTRRLRAGALEQPGRLVRQPARRTARLDQPLRRRAAPGAPGHRGAANRARPPAGPAQARRFELRFEHDADAPPSFLSFTLREVALPGAAAAVRLVLHRPDGTSVPLAREVVTGPRPGERRRTGATSRRRSGCCSAARRRSPRRRSSSPPRIPAAVDARRCARARWPRCSACPRRTAVSRRSMASTCWRRASRWPTGRTSRDPSGRGRRRGVRLVRDRRARPRPGRGAAVRPADRAAHRGAGVHALHRHRHRLRAGGGFVGGRTDLVIQRVADVIANVPVLPLLIFLVFILGSRLWLILLDPGGVQLAGPHDRGALDGAAAAREPGGRRRAHARRLHRPHHLAARLPPHRAVRLRPADLLRAGAILAEAGLSFLGLGDPSLPTWGQILEHGFRTGAVFLGYWWWVVPPGLLIVLTALTFMLLALGMETVVNPRLRRL